MPMRLKLTKYVLAITIAAALFYFALFFYSKGYLFPQPSCPSLGGICREECRTNEKVIGKCNMISCCLPERNILDNAKIRIAIIERDVSRCVGTGADSECKIAVLDMINFDFAKKYKDDSYCNEISNSDTKDICYGNLATILSKKDLCFKIESKNKFDKCLINFVKSKDEWSICAELNSDFNKDICFEKIALLTRSPEICNQLSFRYSKDSCLLKVALSQKNNVYCNDLPEDLCNATKGCSKIIVSDMRESVSDVFVGCERDKKYFCEITGGKWVVAIPEEARLAGETCLCGEDKIHFPGYGCFSCKDLPSYAQEECFRSYPQNATSSQ